MKTPEQIIQEQVNPTKPRGGLGGLLDYAKTRNNDTGLSRMQNFAAALDPLILPEMRAGEGIRERGAQRVAAGNKNKTIQMLIDRGREDLAKLVKSGAITAQQAASVLLAPSKDNRIALQKRAELAGLVPGTPEYQTFMLKGGVSSGGAPAQFGAIPAGYQLIEGVDESGNRSYSMQPVPGSKAALEAEVGKENLGKVEDEQEFKDVAFVGAGERILKAIDEGKFIQVTGVIADKLKDTPFGQVQRDVAEDLELLATQMQFEAISAMKAASRTGASGLGQLTDAERKAVGKLKTNFDNAQSSEAVKRAVKSSILLKAYFKNGLKDLSSNEERNATPQEMEAMVNGINPFLSNSNLSIGNVPSFSSPSLSDKDLEEKYM